MTTQPHDSTLIESPIEDLVPGLTCQWLFNRHCLALTAQHSSVELVDAWAGKIIEVASSWPQHRTFFVLNDFSGKDCVSTPYNQQKNRELAKMFPHLKSVTALVVRQNLTMQLSRIFIRAIPMGNKKVQFFFKRDEALAWIQRQIETSKGTH
jgi:hypothetical protein